MIVRDAHETYTDFVPLCSQDVHSSMLQFMRYLCGEVAKGLQYQEFLYTLKRGTKLGAEKVKAQLLERFMIVFGRVESDIKMKEEETGKEADKFMMEFMVLET